ncbi:hypothetical protein K440DRAFT_620218 [Wilcoxina mikolae CBS 423.85]|nr:hypothetical protein K440DRAFT_620218 [Wilcoxina mikolae CBS 423.85]
MRLRCGGGVDDAGVWSCGAQQGTNKQLGLLVNAMIHFVILLPVYTGTYVAMANLVPCIKNS